MAYFPFFADLDGLPGLIVGGGGLARRKIETLLPYGPRLTVAAPEISPEIQAIPGLTLLERPFETGLLEGAAFVISAAGDREVNRAVSLACRARNIPVNVVDVKEDCTFLFPALVRDGPLTVGISTSGASPAAAVWLKERVASLLPERFGELLSGLDGCREAVKAALPAKRRAGFFTELFARSLSDGHVPDREALEAMLDAAKEEAAR